MKFLKTIAPIIIVVIFSYWAVAPFFIPGFFPIHDDTQVARVFEMHKALVDGMFPVRWVSDLGYGYGYPIFNFYAPLSYYVGGFLNFFTDSLTATKLMMMVGIVLSGVFMYLFTKELWGRIGGVISGLLYVYAPYHALNIYVRGDVGEFWAYSFVPLAFWGIYKIYQTLSFRATDRESRNLSHKSNSDARDPSASLGMTLWTWITIGALGYAGIILSHNLTAMMVTPFLFVFVIVLTFLVKNKKQFVFSLSISFVLALMLSAFYWLPVFPELQYTDVLSQVGGGADYKDHFVCPEQFWNSPWGFGGSTKTCVDGLSFKIGKVHIALAIISMFTFFVFSFVDRIFFPRSNSPDLIGVRQAVLKKIYPLTLPIFLFIFGCLLVSIFLMLKSSQFIWDALSPMAFFQYPWRFLLITSFFVSVLGGGIFWVVERLPRFKVMRSVVEGLAVAVSGVVILVIILVNAELFVPQTIFPKTAGDYTNTYALRWEASKLTDEYLPKGFVVPKTPQSVPKAKIILPSNVGEVVRYQEKTNIITSEVVMNEGSDILIQHAYFPAWHVYLDGKEISYKKKEKGMEIFVPQGKHTIMLRFIQTPIEQLASILSLAGILVLLTGIILSRKEIINAKKTI